MSQTYVTVRITQTRAPDGTPQVEVDSVSSLAAVVLPLEEWRTIVRDWAGYFDREGRQT